MQNTPKRAAVLVGLNPISLLLYTHEDVRDATTLLW